MEEAHQSHPHLVPDAQNHKSEEVWILRKEWGHKDVLTMWNRLNHLKKINIVQLQTLLIRKTHSFIVRFGKSSIRAAIDHKLHPKCICLCQVLLTRFPQILLEACSQ
jgi:hypothetical protein